ncbi:MAG: hypothetical protein QOJ38_1384 [Solirubrobacterales bacterium]|jgi:hypothetical protein|nr:hypothetical protein [Solirubrobacterales bacterium]
MRNHPRLAGAALVAAAAVLAGCGGGDGGHGSLSRPAPSASAFPPAAGQPLFTVLSKASGEGPVASPNTISFDRGISRVPFGVFTPGRETIKGAEVALYAAPGASGKALGPFPARIEDLTTEARFRAQTTTQDPSAATVVYVSEIPFDRNGEWRIGALIKQGSKLKASLFPSVFVGDNPKIPQVGRKAPLIHTPTAADVGGDLAKIDTRRPFDDMHAVDYADAYGRKPIVLLFATPQLCKSRVCGPVVDIAAQVKRSYGDRATFIHMEVYNDNDATKGVRPQLQAFHLANEPWLFAIDRHGVIRARIDGAFGVQALERAVQAAIAGKSIHG